MLLDTPDVGREAAVAFVRQHLTHVTCDDVVGSATIKGGQSAADAALASFDVTGYASRRNEVEPRARRGASGLSPWIRHGLLTLPQVWAAVADGPPRDVQKFRDELMWQEFARHWYARLGPATRHGTRAALDSGPTPMLDRSMACVDQVIGELEHDGWLVNQTRMWMASHWTVRHGGSWREGEDWFFTHLLDGSRAANRLGWQWTTGVGSHKPYGFSRWQVNKRAPGLCDGCPHRTACPIENWPDDPPLVSVEGPDLLRADPDAAATAGPRTAWTTAVPEAVWLTAESLGDLDPALHAHPERPAVFVFDEPLLAKLQLSSKRLVFLTETLAELATTRSVEIHLGSPATVLDGRQLAVTFAPVPGFRRLSERLDLVEIHPWPWLAIPDSGRTGSFGQWRKNKHAGA